MVIAALIVASLVAFFALSLLVHSLHWLPNCIPAGGGRSCLPGLIVNDHLPA